MTKYFTSEGRYVFRLAFKNDIVASVVSHPSLLEIPGDLEVRSLRDRSVILFTFHQKYVSTSTAPLLINSCEVDQMFPAESQEIADKLFGEGKFAPGYRREYFDGCSHGFTVRGDMSQPKVKAGKEAAFKATVEWFIKYV